MMFPPARMEFVASEALYYKLKKCQNLDLPYESSHPSRSSRIDAPNPIPTMGLDRLNPGYLGHTWILRATGYPPHPGCQSQMKVSLGIPGRLKILKRHHGIRQVTGTINASSKHLVRRCFGPQKPTQTHRIHACYIYLH